MTWPRQNVPVLIVGSDPFGMTLAAPASGALLSRYAHGGNEFSLVVVVVTGVTLAEACMRGEF